MFALVRMRIKVMQHGDTSIYRKSEPVVRLGGLAPARPITTTLENSSSIKCVQVHVTIQARQGKWSHSRQSANFNEKS